MNFASLPQRPVMLLMTLAAVGLAVGCHQKKTEAAAPPVSVETSPETPVGAVRTAVAQPPAAQSLPPNSSGIAANASTEAVAGQLSLELRRYVAYTRTIPNSFEDFIAHDPIKFPPPAAGKKFIIADGKVVLR